MKKLTKSDRLQADSHFEIKDAFDAAVKRLARAHGLSFQGGAKPFKLRPGPLLNALVLWFAEQPDQEQSRIAISALAQLELLLAETDEERAEVIQRFAGSLGRAASGAANKVGPWRDRTDIAQAEASSLELNAKDKPPDGQTDPSLIRRKRRKR